MKIANSIEIHATRQVVFSWLEAPDRAKHWMTSVSKTEMISETPERIGTTFRETVEENGRGTELHGVITDFVPNRRLSFHLEGKYNTVDVTYALQESGQDTLLSQTADVHFKGWLRIMGILLAPAFKKKVLDQAKTEFAALKTLCERGDRHS